jgi:hypothetical protein
MVETAFSTILKNLISDKKDVALFALLKMDNIIDRWTVLLGADFKSETERKDMAIYLIGLISKQLSEDDKKTIARIGVFPLSLHLIDDLLNYKVGHYTEPMKANGNTIHEAIIMHSERPTTSPKIGTKEI